MLTEHEVEVLRAILARHDKEVFPKVKTRKRSAKLSKKEEKQRLINDLVKHLGPNVLNYI